MADSTIEDPNMIEDAEEVETSEDSRTPRSLDCRDSSKQEEPWAPPTLLPVPEPQDGWEFRWGRVAIRDEADNRNISQKLRDGWEPVKLSDHPNLHIIPDVDSRFEGNAVVGGLMLCKNIQSKVQARAEYYQEQSRAQMEAVDGNYMRESDARMPMLQSERKTRITFGDGT